MRDLLADQAFEGDSLSPIEALREVVASGRQAGQHVAWLLAYDTDSEVVQQARLLLMLAFQDPDVPESIRQSLQQSAIPTLREALQDPAIADEHKLVVGSIFMAGGGQMSEDDLERIMLDFYDRKFDVLVCTTIVESGLDIPNVNTILINDADKMGLAQLYQLRGRVGRSDKQAYAYLMFKENKSLSEIAEKRLDAIREFTDLGSGLKVALRDLEIRGAGNLLGAEQHGQIAAVGFDLYCQLLSQAISEMKGEEVEEVHLPTVDLPMDAYIPENYIKTEAQRIFFYKKMAAAKAAREVQQIQDELEDRFGDPPRPVWNMLAILRLRIRAYEIGISSISTEKQQILIRFASGFRLIPDVAKELAKAHKRHWFEAGLVRINPNTPRIVNLVEDMVEVVGKGLKASAKRLQAVR
jgi:transcription-repair coupling factor (superfamily II helicase)